MGNRQLQGELAAKLATKFPDTPTKTLARKLFDENRELFSNLEAARSAIRYCRGNAGNHNRKNATDKDKFRENGKAGELLSMPPSLAEPWTPFELPAKIKRLLVLSDLHAPFHSPSAVGAAVAHGKARGCDGLLINGDFGDFYNLSRYQRDPRKRDLKAEIDIQRDMLDWLRQEFPKPTPIIFKFGNHEERWTSYVWSKCVELWNLVELQLEDVLHLKDLNITLVKDQRPVMFKNLPIFHGHELAKGGGVNPARAAFLKTNHTILVGHSHRTSMHVDPDLWHKLIVTWSTGCLCYSSDTEVLTDRGFVTFPDLKDDDRVAEFEPDTKTIIYRKPIAKQALPYSGNMYHFASGRLDLLVTPEHKMLHVKDGLWYSPSAEEAFGRYNVSVPVAGLFAGDNGGMSAEEARLLSWIITEGSLDTSSGYERISIYQKKPDRVREIGAVLMRMGVESSHFIDPRNGVHCFRIGTTQARRILAMLPNMRRIPRRLLNSRLSVLQSAYETLISGDGNRKRRKEEHNTTDYFATTHKGLAEDFQELCCKIGYSVRIKFVTGATNFAPDGYSIYKCLVRKSDYSNVTKRLIVQYTGDVYDLTTATGYFVVRRNGLVSVSGNCDMRPEWARVNKWNHGFAVVDSLGGDNWTIENRHISPEGQVW